MSREQPYQPFHRVKVATEAEVQAMFEKLKRPRGKVDVPTQDEPIRQLADMGLPALMWHRVGAHMSSGCQRYQVSKTVTTNYREPQATYQPWVQVQQLWYIKLGPQVPTFDEAKAVCEAHLASAKP